MQVFVPSAAPIVVAECLDRKRLNKQVIECRQIIKAVCGESSAWRNHPIVKMYSKHVLWLTLYAQCLEAYRRGDIGGARRYSCMAGKCTPPFLSGSNGVQLTYWHRGRLCKKDPEHYAKYFGFLPSEMNGLGIDNFIENVYIVDGKTLWYRDGKLVKVGMFPGDFYGERTWIFVEGKGWI